MEENFIGIYDNVFSKDFCERTIKYFKNMESENLSHDRQNSEGVNKTITHDETVFITEEQTLNFNHSGQLFRDFKNMFSSISYSSYSDRYSILHNSGRHSLYGLRLQKTPVGGGFHSWHFEAQDREASHRLLSIIAYMNDVEEGGETEFLYYPKRVRPKMGSVLLFPASFTHTHRGNPPISNEKYILTGWIEF